jgi:hypothetical protein
LLFSYVGEPLWLGGMWSNEKINNKNKDPHPPARAKVSEQWLISVY